MAESIGRAVFDLTLDDRAFQAGIAKAQNSVKTFTDSTGRLRDEFGRYVKQQDVANQGLNAFAQRAGNVSPVANLSKAVGGLVAQLGTLALAAKAFDLIKEADSAAAAVRTLGVNTGELANRLQLVSASLKANVSTLELTKAAYDVVSAGFADAADAADVLKASALGAKGGFSTIQTVADATTSVLNAYGLSAAKASKIVDGFITTQNDGKIVVDQYASQIGKLAPLAAAAGVGIDELNAAISAATAQGVPVEATFSGLRQVIGSILGPTDKAAQEAARLGINFTAAGLQADGLGKFLQKVTQANNGAADSTQKLFGSVEALTAIQPLLNDGLAKYNQFLQNQKTSSGAAASAAGISSQTISAGIDAIGNALSNVVTSGSFSSVGTLLGGIAETINSISLSSAEKEFIALEQRIELLKQQIEQQKEYKVDTTASERKLADLERRAKTVQSVIGKETSVAGLTEEAKGLSKQAEAMRNAGLDASALNVKMRALADQIALLEGKEVNLSLGNESLTGKIRDELQALAGELKETEGQLSLLETKKTLTAPGVDTTQLDKDISDAIANIERVKAKLNIETTSSGIDAEIVSIRKKLSDPRLALSLFGPQRRKELNEALAGLKDQKKVVESIRKENEKAGEATRKNTKNDTEAAKAARDATKQQVAQAALLAQQESKNRGAKLLSLSAEKANLQQQEARLGFYSQEYALIGQINSVRNQGAIERSNTIKSLLDQELSQASKLAATDGQRRQLELQYGQAKFNQTVAEFDLKARALVTEQASQRASLSFEQQKAVAAGKRAEIEADIALIQAKSANAEKGTAETRQQVELAQEKLDLIKGQNAQEAQLGGLRSGLLADQQAAAREQLEQQRLIALNGQAEFASIGQRKQLQADVNEQLQDQAGYANAAKVSAQNFKAQLQDAAQARGDLSTAFQAQVNTVIDGSQQFTRMNDILSQIATNTSQPPIVNVTVNNSGNGRGNSNHSAVNGTSR